VDGAADEPGAVVGGLARAAVRQTRLQLTVAVLAAGDTVLVAVLGLGGAGGGAYQAASALGRVPLFASNALATATFPQLSRDSAAGLRATALRAYLLVAVFVAGALGTLPYGIRVLLFPSAFAEVGRWLPVTAVLGLALGALNLFVTFLQAEDARAGTAGILAAVAAGYLAVVAAAGAAFAVAGVAAGAAAGALAAAGVVALLPPVRRAPLLLTRSPGAARWLAGALLVVAALALAGNPVLWLAIAAPAGLVTLRAAFPGLFTRER